MFLFIAVWLVLVEYRVLTFDISSLKSAYREQCEKVMCVFLVSILSLI